MVSHLEMVYSEGMHKDLCEYYAFLYQVLRYSKSSVSVGVLEQIHCGY